MTQPFRLPPFPGEDTVIDRSQRLPFRFNGRSYEGFAGDTLASALLANGVHLVSRSFKYHRPRGMVAAGVEEPNAMVQLGEGARSTPNLKATEIPLYAGLVARSVNVFPRVDFDFGAIIGSLSGVMPAGFYYKTFFGSPWLWRHLFEPLIRHAGGRGRAPATADPDYYDRMHEHCDLLVVGGGVAGLMAALTAAASGARVVLADEGLAFGGHLLDRRGQARNREDDLPPSIGGLSARDWIRETLRQLENRDNVRLLPGTTVFGYYDSNFLAALERRIPPGQPSSVARSRERLWHFRARQVILATGAHERPLVFANNDRPGIMLAGAVSAFTNRWSALPGRRAVIFTNNDRAYETAVDLAAAGATVAAVCDVRPQPRGPLVEAVRALGIPVKAAHAVIDTRGRKRVTRVAVAPLSQDSAGLSGPAEWLACDLLAVSGGLSPAVHLHSQSQGKLTYDPDLSAFRPEGSDSHSCVGACNGHFSIGDALREGAEAGHRAARACGLDVTAAEEPEVQEVPAGPPAPFWLVPDGRDPARGKTKHFVDFQNDTTAADIRLAVQEGFESVEHMKRYTLTGFGTDQGKTSNVNGLAILAGYLREPIPEVGTTTFRPPYTPVTFAAMGGRDRKELFDPVRLTSIHEKHLGLGARFEDVGQWKRPWYYPVAGEDMETAVERECIAVRQGVGVLDASTLGKIDIQGPDAPLFLDRVYTNNWLKLPVGRIRYGIMCRDDGMVFDDGTTARVDEQRYFMTTTTGNAAAVLDHLEEQLQTEWRDLRVRLTSVTEQWATVSIAGPDSRRVLAKLAPDFDGSATAFPFLEWRDTTVAGLRARIFRISFTGELQFEINVAWHHAARLWDALMEAGKEFNITPYGTETMHVLRAEKGFIIIGQETDGTQTPQDLGLHWAVSDRKDFIGRRSLHRPDCLRPDRKQLVGLLPRKSRAVIPEGTQLVATGTSEQASRVAMQGFVTSSYWSPAMNSRICLALVQGGQSRHGEWIEAAVAGAPVPVRIAGPVFYDPEGSRRDGA